MESKMLCTLWWLTCTTINESWINQPPNPPRDDDALRRARQTSWSKRCQWAQIKLHVLRLIKCAAQTQKKQQETNETSISCELGRLVPLASAHTWNFLTLLQLQSKQSNFIRSASLKPQLDCLEMQSSSRGRFGPETCNYATKINSCLFSFVILP